MESKHSIGTAGAPRILYLSKSDLTALGGSRSQLYVDAVSNALKLHAQNRIVQPLKPYLRWRGPEGHIADRIIAMPAYLGGESPIAGIKWVGSMHDNPVRYGLERASALTILNDAETHYPIAVMEGSLINAMRTAAVTTIAARYLAKPDFQRVACVGCGPIGTMQMRTVLEQFPAVTDIHLFDINPQAAERLRHDLHERAPHVTIHIAPTPDQAIGQGELVVTATVTDKPYIPFEWLAAGTFLSNISIMDVHKDVFLQVDKVVVDDWDQCNREKKVINQLVLEGRFSRAQLHAELGEILIGRKPGRESANEVILLNPMGLAIEDVACAQALYQRALETNTGTWLNLY